jgi:hypothetical protein
MNSAFQLNCQPSQLCLSLKLLEVLPSESIGGAPVSAQHKLSQLCIVPESTGNDTNAIPRRRSC